MRFGYPQEPPTLDPLAPGGGSSATRDILRPVLPALFSLDDRLRPEPDLAAAWPSAEDISFDPFTVSLTLRETTWSDGRPIRAEDVRFSWMRLREGPTGYRYRFLEDVEVTGARSFRLRFDRPVRRWWALFSVDDMVLPAHAYSEDWHSGPSVAGGPFLVGGWTQGLQVSLRRNDRYWGRTALVAGVDVLFVPNDETRLQLLANGELDGFFAEGETNIGRRASARGFEVATEGLDGSPGATGAFGPTWWELRMDPGRIDPAVVRAVSRVVDTGLVAEILEDSGRSMDGIAARFPSGAGGAGTSWAGRGDLDEARAIMREAGVREGTQRASFQLAFPRGSSAGALANFIYFRLREVGIGLDLVGLEPRTFEADWARGAEAPAVLHLRRGADAPDAGSYLSGVAGFGGTEADGDIDAAETEAFPQELSDPPLPGLDPAAWERVQQHHASSGAASPLVRVRSWIVGHGISGARSLGTAAGPFWNLGTWSLDVAE